MTKKSKNELENESKFDIGNVADVGIAVTVTLVFSDEAHRESWLEANGFIPTDEQIEKAKLTARYDSQRFYNHVLAKRSDYLIRQNNTNLVYHIGALCGGKYIRNPYNTSIELDQMSERNEKKEKKNKLTNISKGVQHGTK